MTEKRRNPNRNALITIVAKQLLVELRPRYPGASLRAFPNNYGHGVTVSFVGADREMRADLAIFAASCDEYYAITTRKLVKHGKKQHALRLRQMSEVHERLQRAEAIAEIVHTEPANLGGPVLWSSVCQRSYPFQFSLAEPNSCDILKLWMVLNLDDLLLQKHQALVQ